MEPETQKSKDHFLSISILLAAVMISGSIIYLVKSGSSAAPGPAQIGGGASPPAAATRPAPDAQDVILGNQNAPVTLIEYGDYQCPYCAKFFLETELPLRTKYIETGKVKMVFRNFSFLGPESLAAAAAAECAKDQHQFWAYHDALYNVEIKDGSENNGKLTKSLFVQLAGQLKLDTGAFTSCLDSKKYDATVVAQTKDAQNYGVNATPTVFVNDRQIQGAQPLAQFTSIIDDLLKSK